MHWLVSGRILKTGREEGMARFGRELLWRLPDRLPNCRWTVVLDGEQSQLPAPHPALQVVHAPVSADNPVGMLFYLEYWLPRLAQKLGANAIFSPDGWTPLRTPLPTLPVIHDLNFEVEPRWIPFHWRHLYRLYFPRLARRAHQLVTVSQFSSHEIQKLYAVPSEKISVVYNAPSTHFKPIPLNLKKQARVEFADGNPYFFVPLGFHPRKNVKKILNAWENALRADPGLPLLVLAGRPLWADTGLKKQVQKLQMQNWLKLCPSLAEEALARAVGGAEAVLYLSLYEGFGLPIVEAQAAGVPVLTSATSAMPEVGGDACLYADPKNVEDMAQKMLQIWHDDALRRTLSEKGLRNAQLFRWEDSAGILARVMRTFEEK